MKKDNETPPQCRRDVEYSVNGEVIRSWLYIPEQATEPVPCIIMCNGFGGTKDIVLEKYAIEFIKAGIASLALEYRHYGESDGQPRQFYSSIKQLEDIQESVKYVRSLKEIDSSRIFIWGTSAGGGYGINVAADDHKICGVIAQCTSLDHKKDDKLIMEREGWGFMFKIIAHAQRDKGCSRFGLSPHMIPLVGIPGSSAMSRAEDVLVSGNYVMIATNGGISKSIDGTPGYETIDSNNSLYGGNVNTIFNVENRLFAGTDGGLYISDDDGASFISKTGADGLSSEWINGITIDSKDIIYVSTIDGVSISFDDGATFTTYKSADGLTHSWVTDIIVVEK